MSQDTQSKGIRTLDPIWFRAASFFALSICGLLIIALTFNNGLLIRLVKVSLPSKHIVKAENATTVTAPVAISDGDGYGGTAYIAGHPAEHTITVKLGISLATDYPVYAGDDFSVRVVGIKALEVSEKIVHAQRSLGTSIQGLFGGLSIDIPHNTGVPDVEEKTLTDESQKAEATKKILESGLALKLCAAGATYEPKDPVDVRDGTAQWQVLVSKPGRINIFVRPTTTGETRAKMLGLEVITDDRSGLPIEVSDRLITRKNIASWLVRFLGSLATLPGLLAFWRSYRQDRAKKKADDAPRLIVEP